MRVAEEIWIINDDRDDQELIKEIFKESKLGHDAVFFETAEAFIQALKNAKEAPFIILCEINLPRKNGFELRQQMLDQPNSKFHGVPFIFWSTHAGEEQITRAYEMRAHGFFIKEHSYKEWKVSLVDIIRYWHKSKMPSKEPRPEKPL